VRRHKNGVTLRALIKGEPLNGTHVALTISAVKAGWEVLEHARLLENSDQWEFHFNFGNNEQMLYSLAKNRSEFWKHWSVVTGIPMPPGIEEKTRFHCAC